MALDTSIPLQVRPPQIESPQNVLMNAVRYQGAQGQLAEQQRSISERNALADVLRQPGTFGQDGRFSRSALPAIAAASPEAVPQYAGLANQQDATADQGELRRMQLAKQSMQVQGQLLQGVRDESSYQAAKQQAQQYGIDVSQLPPNYDPAFVQQALARTMSQMEQFDMNYRQAMLDLSRQRTLLDSRGLTAPQQSSSGFFQTDKFGNVSMVNGPDGKPLMPATIDPNAQGNVSKAKSYGSAQGKAQADNEQGFGQAEATANEVLGVIDKAINHPGREYATGLSSMLPIVAGTDAADFNAVLDQIKGQTFLQAFQSLKGGGAITEVEGTKATQAIARLERAQSEKEFLQSLQDLRGIVANGVERARKKAGAAAQTGSNDQTAAPAQRQISRRGRLPDGRQVVEYTDGTREVIQ